MTPDELYLRYLLESLTPGGSEFHDDPERCVAWIKDRLAFTAKIAAERNGLRDLVKRLCEGLDWALDWLVLDYDPDAPNVDPEWADAYNSAHLALRDAREQKGD